MFRLRYLQNCSPIRTFSLRVAGIRYQSGTSNAAHEAAHHVIKQRTQKLSKDIEWIQQLLDTTEGGGYLVSRAGLLGQNITWGDHDEFGHVNNVVYLKWFEAARVNEFLRMGEEFKGTDFESFMAPRGVGPIIRSVNLAWRYPIQYPDTITVLHKLLPITQPDRFELKGVVVSHKAKKVAARIHETVVTVDYDKGGVKAPIPKTALEAFQRRLALQEELAPERK